MLNRSNNTGFNFYVSVVDILSELILFSFQLQGIG
jgi:hypothetical protein